VDHATEAAAWILSEVHHPEDASQMECPPQV